MAEINEFATDIDDARNMLWHWVDLHPATDAWMRGDRTGTCVAIGKKWVYVKMDASGRTLKLHPTMVKLSRFDKLA